MKKVLFSAAALLAVAFASAQETETGKGFKKGDFYMTGAVGFSSEKTGDFKTNEFTIAPTAGYFVSNNIAVGLNVGYVSTKEENPVDGDVDTDLFVIGAFGRYYATPANDFSFFGQLGFNYGTGKTKPEGGGDFKVDGFEVALRPGVSYFLSKNVAIEASIGALSYSSIEPDGGESTDSFEIGVNLTEVQFGVVYKF
ncbi:outer membrane beta-barrel protein [Flavobacterium sp.]|uniref:outer membrane beta-barrel protein n=1 Tax=Flavobacterium sp. TaxID=239 RepID=UPI00120A4FD9|nr:outer membrane beta-barrel protein [Flavobacterium sp.]RZJ73646.1 MAG: porin family protein [Flavobacterium sp.]